VTTKGTSYDMWDCCARSPEIFVLGIFCDHFFDAFNLVEIFLVEGVAIKALQPAVDRVGFRVIAAHASDLCSAGSRGQTVEFHPLLDAEFHPLEPYGRR
jgi:hypothetical protein